MRWGSVAVAVGLAASLTAGAAAAAPAASAHPAGASAALLAAPAAAHATACPSRYGAVVLACAAQPAPAPAEPAPARPAPAAPAAPAVVAPQTGVPFSAHYGEGGSHWAHRHTGLDFNGEMGDPVRAVVAARVERVDHHKAYGLVLVLRRADGVELYYAHLSKVLRPVGAAVRMGEVVALEGSSGNSTGAHLHLEVRVDGVPTDPEVFLWGPHPGTPGLPAAWACRVYGCGAATTAAVAARDRAAKAAAVRAAATRAAAAARARAARDAAARAAAATTAQVDRF